MPVTIHRGRAISGPNCKIQLIGEPGSGVTSLILKAVKNVYTGKFILTLGSDSLSLSAHLDDREYTDDFTLELVDAPSVEQFAKISNSEYGQSNNRDGLVLVCTPDRRDIFERLPIVLRGAREHFHCRPNSPTVMVITKTDLPEEEWLVTREEFEAFARQGGIQDIYYVSSKNNDNSVDNAFESIAETFAPAIWQSVAKRATSHDGQIVQRSHTGVAPPPRTRKAQPASSSGSPVRPASSSGRPVQPASSSGGPVRPASSSGSPVQPASSSGGPVRPASPGSHLAQQSSPALPGNTGIAHRYAYHTLEDRKVTNRWWGFFGHAAPASWGNYQLQTADYVATRGLRGDRLKSAILDVLERKLVENFMETMNALEAPGGDDRRALEILATRQSGRGGIGGTDSLAVFREMLEHYARNLPDASAITERINRLINPPTSIQNYTS